MKAGRRELVAAVAGLGLTRERSALAVKTIIESVTGAILADEAVSLRGFGSFHSRGSRRALMWDPRTGATRPVKPATLVRFRPCREFVEGLRKGPA